MRYTRRAGSPGVASCWAAPMGQHFVVAMRHPVSVTTPLL
jgi:hypothetical protein